VGPELVYSVQEVFKSASIPVDFESYFFSEVNPTLSAPLEDVARSITKNRVCLKGILATPDYSHTGELQTLNMKLRNALDLYANVVHVKSLPGVKSRHEGIDCVIIREQTEGEYSALEHEGVKGVVECLKIVTATKSQRIAKFAFDYATKNNRKKVTAVHKANIMKLGDGLFLRSCEEIAKLYPKIEFEKMIVDNCTMQMVSQAPAVRCDGHPQSVREHSRQSGVGARGGRRGGRRGLLLRQLRRFRTSEWAPIFCNLRFSYCNLRFCIVICNLKFFYCNIRFSYCNLRFSSVISELKFHCIFLSLGSAPHLLRSRRQERGQPHRHAPLLCQIVEARQSSRLRRHDQERGGSSVERWKSTNQRHWRTVEHPRIHIRNYSQFKNPP
jgi:hypothetical protein